MPLGAHLLPLVESPHIAQVLQRCIASNTIWLAGMFSKLEDCNKICVVALMTVTASKAQGFA